MREIENLEARGGGTPEQRLALINEIYGASATISTEALEKMQAALDNIKKIIRKSDAAAQALRRSAALEQTPPDPGQGVPAPADQELVGRIRRKP